MDDFLKRTWLEIDLDAIRGNYQKIRSFVAPEAKVMAVIKADAYGHGVEYTAREMSGAGVDWFAVSNLEEAIQVRRDVYKRQGYRFAQNGRHPNLPLCPCSG